jgi:hypothetical protein
MDTHPDNLNDVERRLAACQPATDGLDADALLFAAGRASARRGPARFIWPSLALSLAVVSISLGVWLAQERAERIRLARELDARPAPAAPPAPSPAPAEQQPPSSSEPPSSSVLASHHMLEQDIDKWPTPADSGNDPPDPTPDPPVLRVGLPDSLIIP